MALTPPEPPLPPSTASSPAPTPSSVPPSIPSTSATTGTTSTSSAIPHPKPLEPLTGFRAALEHTGLPRGVLTWKPRLPSRNWCIFWTVVGTVSYLYYDDRKQCKVIKERTVQRVRHYAEESMEGSLDMVRKVKVYGGRWPEDDDTDRALRYFRKYVKPYLVAAAVDYEQVQAPLYGSITRQVHAQILAKRRQRLGLEPFPPSLSLPGVLDPMEVDRRETEAGVVLVGRHSLKEYMEGLKRGWLGRVDEWEWEKDVEEKLQSDGVFASPPLPDTAGTTLEETSTAVESTPTPVPTAAMPAAGLSGSLAFLSRPKPAALSSPSVPGQQPMIPPQFHLPPNPLPPSPPMLLLPFVSHLGFKQIPSMIYDFFTERYRVQSGADAAIALIEGQTRPFEPSADLSFNEDSEKWFKKDWSRLPTKIEDARKVYYNELRTKVDDTRALVAGDRQLTEEEKKSTKPLVTEDELKEERKKKELRWMGQEEGWEILNRDVTWDERFEGWLRVYQTVESKAEQRADEIKQ